MALYSPKIDELIDALQVLPSVGPKSAQRIAFYLLERDRSGAIELSSALKIAMSDVIHCGRCRNFSEAQICHFCSHPKRDPELLCIVETPADVLAIEQTHNYKGLYFVLMGHLSPLDGIGPNEIGIELLIHRMEKENFTEIILATNSTVEGEATAHYISKLAKNRDIKVTRIAHGVPIGAELEYINDGTLAHALAGRIEI